MDINTICGCSLMKQNQFLFNEADYERNQQAVERARAQRGSWIKTLRANALWLRGLRLARRRTSA